MYATSERRSDGKPSSRGALVDVEVDRCIDENSASNLKHRFSLNKASSTKTEDPSINQISDSSQIASRNPNFFLTVTREAPTTDKYTLFHHFDFTRNFLGTCFTIINIIIID